MATDSRLRPPAAALCCRLVCRLARQLASWDEKLQWQLRAMDTDSELHIANAMLLECFPATGGAATVASALAASREDALEVCRAARLLQGSGRLQAELLMARVQSAPAGASTQLARSLLAGSVRAQFRGMTSCLLLASDSGALGDFAQQVVAPNALLPWLRAGLAALEVVPLREFMPVGELGWMWVSVLNFNVGGDAGQQITANRAIFGAYGLLRFQQRRRLALPVGHVLSFS